MTPENVIYIQSRQTTTFVNDIDKFSFGERRLFCLLVCLELYYMIDEVLATNCPTYYMNYQNYKE